jgi:molybdopterin-guanine dinucleotide biosynthesis protein A
MTATAGVLLTGGRSRRLGVDKASLVLDGETLARRAARRLDAVCSPVLEAGDGVSGLPAVR